MTVAEAQIVRDAVKELVLLVKIHAEGRWSDVHDDIYNNILTMLGSLRNLEQSRRLLADERVRTMIDEGLE